MFEAITQSIIHNTLQNVFNEVQKQIDQIQLCKHIPQYLRYNIFSELKINMQSCQPKYDHNIKTIQQPNLKNIPVLRQDSLMPKNVTLQIQPIDLQASIISSQPKMKLKKRGSIMGATINSLKMSQRQQSIKSINNKSKPKKQSQLISLTIDNQQDYTIVKLRSQYQTVETQKQKLKASQKQRQRQLKEKMQAFNSEYTSRDYTFNFDGNVIDMEIDKSSNMKTHGAKLKLGDYIRRMREDFKTIEQVTQSVNFKLKKKDIQNPDKISATQNIPMFLSKTHRDSIFGPPSSIQQCKLKQFKKHYGGRYHRLDKSLHQTIQVKPTQNSQYDLFATKRQIRDSQSLKNSQMIDKHDKHMARKIALPKLKGVYKVLDRYEQV